MNIELTVKKYNQEGDLAHEYNPLRNKLLAGQPQESESGELITPKDLTNFRTKEIEVDLNNPLDIECQPSYDGTVNLIINDDKNPPRIINTRFTTTENNRYKIINRNQKEQTNIYEETNIDQQTRLFRNLNSIPRIQLVSIDLFGQLKGGNYTFYVKFADNDFNKTDIVCESGQIPIFNGTIRSPKTISGTLQDERTDKSISIKINNIDTSFQKVYLYYTRETSDVNGARITEAAMIKEPYDIKNSYLDITVNGYEEVQIINEKELNIKYLYVDRVKTQAQNQGMLFFGNVEMTTIEPRDFQALSLYIDVSLKRLDESIGYIDTNYNNQSKDDSEQTEYYNPQNIYYNLGYWPDEMYRLGIVYIMRDDSLSEVFNLRGVKFELNPEQITGDHLEDAPCSTNVNYNQQGSASSKYNMWRVGIEDPKAIQDDTEYNPYKIINGKPVVDYKVTRDPDTNKITASEPITGEWSDLSINYVPKEDFILNGQHLDNIMGVFKMPKDIQIFDHNGKNTYPWGFEISFPEGLREKLRSMGIKGFFIVRQKRIPTILCQGLAIGVDPVSSVPTIPIYENGQYNYISEGFIDEYGTLSTNFKKKTTIGKATSALLSLDSCVTPLLQSTFDGSEYVVQEYEPRAIIEDTSRRQFIAEAKDSDVENNTPYRKNNNRWTSGITQETNILYVGSDIPYKFIGEQGFSTRAGAAEEVKQISFFGNQTYEKENRDLLRGVWCPILGTTSNLKDGWIYNVRIKNFSKVFEKEYFKIRGNDNSPFYAITDRWAIDDVNSEELLAFRGDCYTCTVTLRIQRNFIDSDVPTNTLIVDPNTWKTNYNGYNSTDEDAWLSINRGDVNSVPIGSWITWKCLSNYNLGLRSLDYTNVEETALMGNPRSFYPISGLSIKNKQEESWKLNEGYSATVSKKAFLPIQDIPYVRDIFDTRVMFSNVQQDDAFLNAYRIFQGLSFEDMDRQYGGLVKLISWGTSLLAIFEHGITIIPVNEKALLSTTNGQSVHLYGDGVLQRQMSVISQDYGTIWKESIIRTPLGVYGVDTYAKKIWRFSQDKGLELISDAKIQRYLNDHIKLKEKDKYPIIALRNVKTHYNNYKGDIMFTFYNDDEDEEWNVCYNERLDKWATRYSWIPLYSENVNNVYYSLDKKRAEILAYIYNNINASSGIVSLSSKSNLWNPNENTHTVDLRIKNYDFYKYFHFEIKDIKSSYLDENNVEQFITLDSSNIEWASNTTLVNYKWVDEETKEEHSRLELRFTDSEAKQGKGKFKINNEILTYNGHKLYYLYFIVTATPYTIIGETTTISDNIITGEISTGNSFNTIFGIVVDTSYLSESSEDYIKYNELLSNGFYVHGRAGIFDEIDYFNEERSKEDQIMPTVWYDKQEPFEFEFVVTEPTGLHKIFNNLVLISNNVQPSEIEYEIVGDVYNFNKAGIFWSKNKNYWEKRNDQDFQKEWSPEYNKPIELLPKTGVKFNDNLESTGSQRLPWIKNKPSQTSEEFKNAEVEWDPILNQYLLKIKQPCYDIKNYGRMRGNITYKEDAWYLTIDPIYFRKADSPNYNEETKTYDATQYSSGTKMSDWKSTRIRDKWCRIRIKYSGKDLVLISAIKTMIMTSYA